MKVFESLDDITSRVKSLEVALGHKIEGLEEMAGKVGHTVSDKVSDKVSGVTDKVSDVTEKIEIPEHNFNHSDILRNRFMLQGNLAEQGYDWWWHSFTGRHAVTGEERAFFIEFFTINPALGEKDPVLGQLPENRDQGRKPSYMMIKVGAWGRHPVQLHRFFGWDDVTVRQEAPYLISADNCVCSENRTIGMVEVTPEEAAAHPEYMCDAGRMYWDLVMDKQIAFNVGYGAGTAMRETEVFEMFWHCEGMKTAFEGKVFLDGEEYIVSKENSYGYADKNWGRDFTSPWLWLSSNHLISKTTGQELKDSAFVIGGGKPKIGKLALENKLLGAMWYEGEPYEFNFSKFWTLTKTSFKCKEKEHTVTWRVVQKTPMAKMCTEISCPKEEMIFVNYESPDGERRHRRLWNGGNGEGTVKLYKKILQKDTGMKKPVWKWELVDEIQVKNAGCEYGEYQE
jgi:hypothetical protein